MLKDHLSSSCCCAVITNSAPSTGRTASTVSSRRDSLGWDLRDQRSTIGIGRKRCSDSAGSRTRLEIFTFNKFTTRDQTSSTISQLGQWPYINQSTTRNQRSKIAQMYSDILFEQFNDCFMHFPLCCFVGEATIKFKISFFLCFSLNSLCFFSW